MLKNLSENLNLLMAKARLNSNELARHTGIPATTIKRMRTNEQSNPTILTLLPIAKHFSITLNQLIGNHLDVSSTIPTFSDIRSIPLLTWQECINYNSLDYKNYPNKIFTEKKISDKSYALKVEDSDINFFPENSILIIDPETEPHSGDFIIVTKTSLNVVSIKKYIVDTDHIYLKSTIEGLGITQLTQEYKILGVVMQYKVELKAN